MLFRSTILDQYRSDEDITAQAAEFMMSIDPYINEPEQYAVKYYMWSNAGYVQDDLQHKLEKDSEEFSSYIEEWSKSRNNPDTIWRGVLTAILQCLTNSWVTSDHRCRRLWRNIKAHWATFVVDFEPFPVTPKSDLQGINSREQCLHWILVKFHKAANTLLKQDIAPKLLAHLDQTKSDNFLFSDLKILFVCLRMRRVRVLHFHHPLLEEGLEDAAEMVSFHNSDPIADYAKKVLILRPIAAKLIPLIKFRREYRPNVSRRFKEFRSNGENNYDDACSSDDEIPIDVEKEAEKRVIHGQFREESSSEPSNSDHEDEDDESFEETDEQEEQEEDEEIADEDEDENEEQEDENEEQDDESEVQEDENEGQEEQSQSEASDENDEFSDLHAATALQAEQLLNCSVTQKFRNAIHAFPNPPVVLRCFRVLHRCGTMLGSNWIRLYLGKPLSSLFTQYLLPNESTLELSLFCWESLADHSRDESFITSFIAKGFFSSTFIPTLTFFATAIANSPENELSEPYQHILSHVVTVSETFSVRIPSPTLELSILLPFFLATDPQSFHIVAELLFHRKFQVSPSDLSETAVRYRIHHSSPILSDTVLNALTAKVVALEEIIVQMSDGHILGYADPVAEMFHKPRIVKKALHAKNQHLRENDIYPLSDHIADSSRSCHVGNEDHPQIRVNDFLTLFGEDGDAVDTFKDVVGWLLSIPHPPLTDTAINLCHSLWPMRRLSQSFL
ncbi:hypothetical protein BLNAU_10024 [Blattamonas nauphoetae]|uniref:Uncharacterized protein n=1 Tax=Blattamonas nauphoetae TaxID=2049346 RepID=A0ABQ9XUD4_9EUKA|nr:hypothetical protein BLNAU_10024 [Blattamonas nauphoetae]